MVETPSKTPITIPAAYALLVIEALRNLNVPEDEYTPLLMDSQGKTGNLAEPATRVPIALINELITVALRHESAYAFAVRIGSLMKLSSHGFIGFAAMTARNVREALDIAERYVLLRLEFVTLRLEVSGETAHLFLEDTLDVHPLREALLLALAFGFYTMGRMATGRKLFGTADLDFPMPAGLEAFAELFSGIIRFGQPFNRFSFSASYLDYPLLMSDPVALQLAIEQCEQELTLLGRERNFLQRVRLLIQDNEAGFLSAEQLADRLHLSSRTLKRQLAQHNTSYSEILEDARRRKAALLLENHNLSIDHIAEALGYSDIANFSRAFKRWTGLSPNAYRKSR